MKVLKQESIFVDESGDPGLSISSRSATPYFTYGFVYCKNPMELRKNLRRLLKRLHRKDAYPGRLKEIKFFLPEQKMRGKLGYSHADVIRYKVNLPDIRNKMINILKNSECTIFSSILKKASIARTTWTPIRIANYILAQSLFVNVLNVINTPVPPSILMDQGRIKKESDFDNFQKYIIAKESYFGFRNIKKYSGNIDLPQHISSESDPGIWAADIVAGAFNLKYKSGNDTFANDLSSIGIGAECERRFWF